MNIFRKLTTTVPVIAAMAATTIGLVAAPDTASAYLELNDKPTIGCVAGLLEIHGRGVLASFNGEVVYSRIDIYRYTSTGWVLDNNTGWKRLNAGVTTIAENDWYGTALSDHYYAAIEHLARWDGAQWRFDSEVTQLMSSYASFGTYYGSGYYARCS